jgi:pilus assembly protein Flp/PilA
MERIKRFFKKEEGVTVIEYAVIAAGIIVVALVAIQLTGTNVTALFNTVATAVAP